MIERERDLPDLEDLAAYLDGRLAGERRSRVEERLLRDEDYYQVFLDSAGALEQQGRHGEAVGGEVVAPAVWWRSWQTLGPLAVAAAVAAAVALTFGLPRLLPGPSTDQWLARLDAAAVVGASEPWDDPGWNRLRGGSDPDSLERQERAFRLGSHAVDLAVALAGGDRDAARSAAVRLEQLTGDSLDFLGISAGYADLRDRIEGDPLDVLDSAAATQEAYLASAIKGTPEAGRYALGRWNEAGRLAALAGDQQVLEGLWRRRRVARDIVNIEPQLAKLEAAIGQPAPDFEAAQAAFSEIARALAGRG